MTKHHRRFKNKVATLIASDAYHMADVWPGLKEDDQKILIHMVRLYTKYKDAHAGVVAMMTVKRIFEMIDYVEQRYSSNYLLDRKVIDRIRGQIKRKIKRDVKRNEYLAHLRAGERRTA